MAERRVVVSCVDCGRIVTVGSPRLEPKDLRRLGLHFGQLKQHPTTAHARRHITIRVKESA